MTNEELAGVDELVGRLRQPNECERWLFSVPFEAADMLQSLIATAREAEALRAENARLRDIPNRIWAEARDSEWDEGFNYAVKLFRAALEQGEVK